MSEAGRIRRALWILVILSLIVRVAVAAFTELGNDEVYYWTYAKFPDWSHFDHPPMVGWVIQLFTLNLTFSSEFFLRLPSIVLGTLDILLIYLIGKNIKNRLTGLYAAFLFTASFYGSILSSTFILPDTPQVFFWLLTLLLLTESLPDRNLLLRSRRILILAGITTGFALLSKYHSAFLITGTFLYMLFFNRKWFRTTEAWIGFLVALLMFLPVVLWNYHNHFISFTFQEHRIGEAHHGIRWDYFLTEVGGQVFYNNPINFLIILLSLLALFTGRKYLSKEPLRLLLLISLPLALVFPVVALFSRTLPHWTGPAYLGLILVASAWLEETMKKPGRIRLLPWPAGLAAGLALVFVLTAFVQIRTGWIPFRKLGWDDPTTQLYGWKQLGEKFRNLAAARQMDENMDPSSPIITFRWFPAAQYDYYVAAPEKRKVYALGPLERIHKYYWIDKARGNIPEGTNAYYIALSDDFRSAPDLFGSMFRHISGPDTLRIYRGKELVREAYVYRLLELKKEISFDRVTDFVEPSPAKVRYWRSQIFTHPEWYRLCVQKAREQHRDLDDILWEEAAWAAVDSVNR